MTAALEVRGLSKSLGGMRIIHDLNLSVAAGERLAVVGPNGAGKSTLFNLISGKFAPSAGTVLLHGQDISGLPAHDIARLGLSRSFQITQVFSGLSVADNLRCACLAALGHGLNPFRRLSRLRAVNARVEQMIERTGLQRQAQALAGELSYAEQRRLELGMALAGQPSVLLLDEPTAGMNRSEADQAVALIRELTEGKTLLLVEHDMGVAFELADRMAVLDQGSLLALGRPQDIREDPRVQQVYLQGLAC